jgi:hypothetical protein
MIGYGRWRNWLNGRRDEKEGAGDSSRQRHASPFGYSQPFLALGILLPFILAGGSYADDADAFAG